MAWYQGVPIEVLTSHTFIEGRLDLSRFEDQAQEIFTRMLNCSREKDHELLGRIHLLFGMLTTEGGAFDKRLRGQGQNPEYLADRLYVSLPSGNKKSPLIDLNFENCSRGLLRIICKSEEIAHERSSTTISDEDIMRAFFKRWWW